MFFSPTETMGMMKIRLSIMLENTASGTELPRTFCAGIGPLQPGVVLVFIIFILHYFSLKKSISINLRGELLPSILREPVLENL